MPGVRVDANVGGSDAGMNASSDPGPALLEVRGLSKSFGTHARPAGGGFHLARRRSPRAARRERRGQVHADQGPDRRLSRAMPAIVRLDGAEVAPRSAKAAVATGIAHRLSGGQSAAEPVGGARTSISAASRRASVWSRERRDAPLRHRAARELRPAISMSPSRSETIRSRSSRSSPSPAPSTCRRKVLILDEPTASLDRHEVEMPVRGHPQARARGLAIIFITHFLDQVYAICRPHHRPAQRPADRRRGPLPN